jgi:hypothetical protein
LDSGAALEPENWPVYWTATHNVNRLAAGEPMDMDRDIFAGFGEWVPECLDAKRETQG